MESVGGYAYFVSEGTLSADPKIRWPEVPFLFLSENIFLYVFRARKRIPLMNSIIFVRLLSDCFKSKEDKRL